MILYAVLVKCTDRRQHPSRELAALSFYDRGGEELRAHLDENQPHLGARTIEWIVTNDMRIGFYRERDSHRGDQVKLSQPEQIPGDPHVADATRKIWRFVCPTCPRDVPLGNKNLTTILDGLVEAAQGNTPMISLDVSYLPANLK